jgi:hypothetical protein
MSEARAEIRPPRFFDLYSRGEVTAEQIEGFVERWHENVDPWAKDLSLHEYLGLSDEEYRVWVYDPDALPHILTARRQNRPLREVIAKRLDALVLENRPVNQTTISGLRIWLKDREKGGSSD